MTIQGDFYKITPVNDCGTSWDLEILKEVKNTKNPRKEWQNAGYGLSMDSVIKKLVNYCTIQKFDSTTFSEFYKEYQENARRFKDLFV